MKALSINTYGPPENAQIVELEAKPCGPEQVRIRVYASGVNPADLMAISGTHQNTPPTPFTPGFEAAGEIMEVGSQVTPLQVGDRVMASFGHGGHAEEVVCDYRSAARLPNRIDYPTAAAMPVAFGTALLGLSTRAALQGGETLLVVGGSGSVGAAAVQIGKLLGATVIATARSEVGCQRILALGGDVALNSSNVSIKSAVYDITAGQGVDVVFDTVNGPAFMEAFNATAPLGRYLPIGASSGQLMDIGVLQCLLKNVSIISADWDWHLHFDLLTVQSALTTVLNWGDRGWLQLPDVTTHPFTEAANVLSAIAAGKLQGKQVLSDL